MTRVLYWFRTDLRLHDSPALHAALDLNPESFFPIWCWDPNYVYRHRVGLNRFRFLLESMQNVSDSIHKINPLSQLLVIRGDPVSLIPELIKRWKITHLVFEKDENGYSRSRDAQVLQIADQLGITVITKNGNHLWDTAAVVKNNGNKPITSQKSLEKIISDMDKPAKPISTPESLPSPFLDAKNVPENLKALLKDIHSSLDGLPSYSENPGPPEVDLNSAELGGQREPGSKVTCYNNIDGPDEKAGDEEHFTVPTLSSLGMSPKTCGASDSSIIPGGETEALKRLEKLCKDNKYLATFAKPKTSPSTDTLEPSTTLLSPYLKFGCLSVRKLWHDSSNSIAQYKGGDKTNVPESFAGQLLFRELYAATELSVGDSFQGIRGNSICRYMDWYLPTVYGKDGKAIEPRPKGDEVSEGRLEAFRAGQTGFPWIDAGIRQLRITGWCHHLMRHSLAAFLTRGQCWISWERGAEMFEEWLLDWDPNSNPGNWMWLSCSAFFSQFFRVYGLATFPAKYDSHGGLVRKCESTRCTHALFTLPRLLSDCPELKGFPDKYIYAPHTAPPDVQKKAKCIIGVDYPLPILDEKEEKQRCLNRCKVAYSAKFYGDSKEVLDGDAEGILRKEHGQPDPSPPVKDPGTNKKIPEWAKAGHESRSIPDMKNLSKESAENQEEEIKPEHTDEGDATDTEEFPKKRSSKNEDKDGSHKRRKQK